MTERFATISVAALLLMACGEDTEDVVEDGDPSPDIEAEEDVSEDGDVDPDADSDDEAASGDDASAEGDGEDTGGTVTLNGESVELSDAYACEDYTGFIAGGSEAGQLTTDLFTVGRIVTENGQYGAKILAGTYQADGGLEDHVAIYSWDTFDDAPMAGSWSVSEGDDGYPWIEIDGNTLLVDGTHTDEDGNEWVFDAEVEFEIAEGQVRCPE